MLADREEGAQTRERDGQSSFTDDARISQAVTLDFRGLPNHRVHECIERFDSVIDTGCKLEISPYLENPIGGEEREPDNTLFCIVAKPQAVRLCPLFYSQVEQACKFVAVRRSRTAFIHNEALDRLRYWVAAPMLDGFVSAVKRRVGRGTISRRRVFYDSVPLTSPQRRRFRNSPLRERPSISAASATRPLDADIARSMNFRSSSSIALASG